MFLLDKNNLEDTVMYVYFNKKGQIESLLGTDKLINFEEKIRSNNFFYANNRLSAFETIITDSQGNETFRYLSPVTYDSYGNVISLGGNMYEYDYTKKPASNFTLMITWLTSMGFIYCNTSDISPNSQVRQI